MTSCGSPVGSHSRPNFHGGGGGAKGIHRWAELGQKDGAIMRRGPCMHLERQAGWALGPSGPPVASSLRPPQRSDSDPFR